ncbi:hypothetical protein F5X98DRAFT_338122 [Xylaria grammica]|nr:hypothetical protein F5X98DRAFT_338122 [Xylaria grammica]
MVERDTGSDDHIVEDAYDADRDAEWLFAELERYNRRPPWYLESDPDDYGAIDPIFQGDSLICLAYRGARRRARGQARFYGQAALRVKIQELNGAPSKHKEAVVRKLLDIISPELRLSVETWAGHPYRKKRPRDEVMSPPRTRSPEATAATTSPLVPNFPNTPQIRRSLGTVEHTAPTSRHISTRAATSPPKAGAEHSFSITAISKAKAILPDELFRNLEKSYSYEHETFVAHIGMSYKNSDNCEITLRIHSGAVERCAETLFGIRLKTINGLRYITLDNTQILPITKAVISGCKISAITPYFGQPLDAAIRESPTYNEDTMALFSDQTRAVSLVVSQDVNDAGLLILHTNPFGCVHIWDQLY